MPKKGQGTIEYLVILAVIVVVALIVVSLMINSTAPAQGISSGVSKLSTQSAPISIVDASINPDGNVYLKLGNQTGENVTVKSIEIDGTPIPQEQLVTTNSNQGFVIPTNIICSEGSSTSIEIKINYDSQVSHSQTYPDRIIVDCETTTINDSTVNNNQSGGTGTIDTTPPIISLNTPNGDSYVPGIVDFTYTPTDETSVKDCNLLLDGLSVAYDNAITNGSENTFQIDFSSGYALKTYDWTVTCQDNSSNDYSPSAQNFSLACTSLQLEHDGQCFDECVENVAGGLYFSGAGTQQDPYQICSWKQLANISSNLTSYYILINDLTNTDSDYSTYNGSTNGWSPIGMGSTFTGTFDGNNNIISNLYSNRIWVGGSLQYSIGLFSKNGGTVKNLKLESVTIRGGGEAGAVTGQNTGTIQKVSVTGGPIGTPGYYNGGGIAGGNSGTIDECHVNATVDGWSQIGGITGRNDGTINNSYASGSVTSGSKGMWIGGFAGLSGGTIKNSYAANTVYGGTNVGGLVGQQTGGNIYNSYSIGGVTAAGHNYDPNDHIGGGLIGKKSGGTYANAGWYTGIISGYTTNAIGSPVSNITYNESNNTTYYNSGHSVYTAGSYPWSPSIWNYSGSGYPTLTWETQ